MYVCSCRGVTDREVAQAIVDGADSVGEIARACGAGSNCGGCWPTLELLLDEIERPATVRRHVHAGA